MVENYNPVIKGIRKITAMRTYVYLKQPYKEKEIRSTNKKLSKKTRYIAIKNAPREKPIWFSNSKNKIYITENLITLSGVFKLLFKKDRFLITSNLRILPTRKLLAWLTLVITKRRVGNGAKIAPKKVFIYSTKTDYYKKIFSLLKKEEGTLEKFVLDKGYSKTFKEINKISKKKKIGQIFIPVGGGDSSKIKLLYYLTPLKVSKFFVNRSANYVSIYDPLGVLYYLLRKVAEVIRKKSNQYLYFSSKH